MLCILVPFHNAARWLPRCLTSIREQSLIDWTCYRNTFTYDSRGNRTLNNESGTRTTAVYDAANQIRYSQAAAGRTTYSFDANGNQQVVLEPAGTRTTTTWDYENQPTRYNQPANLMYPIVTMAYNADNQRVQKQSPVGTTKFLWDEQNYLAEADVSNVIQTVYTNEPQQFGNLLSTRLGTTPYYHHFDTLGSTRQLTNVSQAAIDIWLYDAWGNVIARTGTTAAFLQWIGELGYYLDIETGLYSIRRRAYPCVLARWSTVDLVDFIGEGIRYRYVRNSPLNLVDPSGLSPEDLLSVAQCQEYCKNWVAKEVKDLDWTKKLPDCPCSLCGILNDSETWGLPEKADPKYHPGADKCVRSNVGDFNLANAPGQQCCYKGGFLITGGPGAGTPDLVGPGPGGLVSVGSHYDKDVLPFLICAKAGMVNEYLKARPPNSGGRTKCDSNTPGA